MAKLADLIDQQELELRRRWLRAERIRKREEREMRRGDIAFRVELFSFSVLLVAFVLLLLDALEKAMW